MGGSKAIDHHFWIGTAHSSKGLEFDIVFLVRACQGAFPLIHPDYVLFRLFGDSERQILDDERRLFYVAVTRAKEQVWFLTETDCESDFVSPLIKTSGPNTYEDPRCQETDYPEERIFPIFSARLQVKRRPSLATCSVFISVCWCTNVTAPNPY